MDINLEKLELCSCQIIREAKAEQSVDCDITLPDYCADIKSVLSCEIEPGINGTDVTGNRITATGNAVVRLVYAGENGKLSCFEQNYPMSKFVEVSSLSADCAVLVNAKVSYVNCRAVSPRRVDVHGCVNMLFCVLDKQGVSVVNSACAQGLELRQLPVTAHSCIGCASKLFEMSEVVPLPEGTGTAQAVIHTQGVAMISEIRAVTDKVLVKGEIRLSITVCSDNSQVSVVEHSLPLSRIIELQGVDEGCLCDVQTTVYSPDIHLKPDENGVNAGLDVAVNVNMLLRAYRELNFAAIEDAYSLCDCLESDRTAVDCRSLIKKLNESFDVNATLDFSSAPVRKVLACWCTDLTCVCGFEKDTADLSGAVTVCVLYEDNDGGPRFAKRRVDYRHPVRMGEVQTLLYEPDIFVSNVSVTGGAASLNARIRFESGGCAFGCRNVNVISDMRLVQSGPKPSGSAITVYFSDKGEQLWDIAKRFNTSVGAIGRRNSLSSETVEENMMLIIPGA